MAAAAALPRAKAARSLAAAAARPSRPVTALRRRQPSRQSGRAAGPALPGRARSVSRQASVPCREDAEPGPVVFGRAARARSRRPEPAERRRAAGQGLRACRRARRPRSLAAWCAPAVQARAWPRSRRRGRAWRARPRGEGRARGRRSGPARATSSSRIASIVPRPRGATPASSRPHDGATGVASVPHWLGVTSAALAAPLRCRRQDRAGAARTEPPRGARGHSVRPRE